MASKGVQERMASQMKAQKGRFDKFMQSLVAVTGTEDDNPEWLTQIMSQTARETSAQVGKGLHSAIQPLMHQLSAQGAALKTLTLDFVDILRSFAPGAAAKSETGGQSADAQRKQDAQRQATQTAERDKNAQPQRQLGHDRLSKTDAESDRQRASAGVRKGADGGKSAVNQAGDAVKTGSMLSRLLKNPKTKLAAKGAGIVGAVAIVAMSLYKRMMRMSMQYVRDRSFMGNFSAEVMSAQIGAQWGQMRRELAQSQAGGGDTAEVIKLLNGIQNELLPVKVAVSRMGASVIIPFLKVVQSSADKVGELVEELQLNNPFVSDQVKDDIRRQRQLMEDAAAANETQMVLHEAILNHNQRQVRQPVQPVR